MSEMPSIMSEMSEMPNVSCEEPLHREQAPGPDIDRSDPRYRSQIDTDPRYRSVHSAR
jgi:hypothetical protein